MIADLPDLIAKRAELSPSTVAIEEVATGRRLTYAELDDRARIHDLVKDDSQFVIATHSPILMAYPGAWIYQCGPQGFERVVYDDTEHVRVTRGFLANPSRTLRTLLD